MKIAKRTLALVLCLAMVASVFVGCGSSKTKKTTSDATYTYNTYIGTSAVQTLNAHEWEYTDESNIMSLTQRGFYDVIISDSADYEYVNEMASAAPVDVTASYAGDYGVPSDASEGYAFEIALRENACWEDGTPINADTYIYSMQQLLDPDMANYRATLYTEGTMALANAYLYYQNGEGYLDCVDPDTYEFADFEEDNVYTSATEATTFLGESLYDAQYGDWEGYFTTEDGVDTVAALMELQGAASWVKCEGEVKDALMTCIETFNTNYGMDYYDGEEYEFCDYRVELEKVDWDQVGLIKNDDYSITFIFDKPFSSTYELYIALTSNFIVKEDLYEANKSDMGGITKTTYGTSLETYSSYGPYKLNTWQEDKEISLTKNESWYGYSDPDFEGQYQTTDIVYTLLDEHSTAVQLFLQGKLDDLALDSNDLDTYASSDYIIYSPTDYTYKISMNTDYDALKARESDGVNKTILSYKDFRKAISLSVDRAEFCQATRPQCSAAFGLLNDMYVYDTDTFAAYRDTEYAENVLLDTYEASSVDDLTGYNVDAAKECYEAAYQAALEAGDIAEGDKVVIEFNCSAQTDALVKSVNFIADAINAATEGTSLEGKVSVEIKEVDDYYASMAEGAADMVFSAWGGDTTDPYALMQCYCDETLYSDSEYGFDSTTELTGTVDGKEYTYSFYDWYYELCEGQWALSDVSTRLQVLAIIEGGILEEYCTIPLWSYREAALLSQKVEYATYDYNMKVSDPYGGFRFMTYNYTDEEWEDYCAEQNNQLEY